MKTWLLVAAERREFAGLLARIGTGVRLKGSGAKFAREVYWKGNRWWLLANGPGPELAAKAFEMGAKREEVDAVVSTGLCGALDPALRIGDVVVAGVVPLQARRYAAGDVHSIDRVAVTARDKRLLRNETGSIAVDMETAAIRKQAALMKVPSFCVRAVSDSAGDDLPLDFNQFRDTRGDFSRPKIAMAALARPFSVLPRLMEFDRDCRCAAETLGEFLADCQF